MHKRSRTKELLEFEIGFYERLLEAHPDFTDALVALGEAYTRSRLYDKGLAVDLKLTQLKGRDPVVWYNLACSYSLLNRSDESLDALQRAVTLGYDDFSHLGKDSDLSHLRQSPKFRRFLETLLPAKPSAA